MNETPATEQKSQREGQLSLTEILNQIEARANAATEAPWKANGDSITTDIHCIANIESDGGYEVEADERLANQVFIAAARSDVPALVAFARLTLDYFSTTARSLRVMGDNAFAQSMDDFVTGLLSESLNVAGAPPINSKS